MSWSVSKSGKAGEIREETAKAFAGITYLQGDEKELKDRAADIVDEVLAVTQPDKMVSISANGHCDVENGVQTRHTFNVSVA